VVLKPLKSNTQATWRNV